MKDILLISCGAILGGNLRYLINGMAAQRTETHFPYGTLAINVSGSLVIGFFMAGPWRSSPNMRAASLLVAVGFCGGFTTFSGYALDSMALLERGQWLLASMNILSNNVLSLGAVLLGVTLARIL